MQTSTPTLQTFEKWNFFALNEMELQHNKSLN